MYVSVLLVIFGQALRFGSRQIAAYGLVVWLGFHIVVVLFEEPHLREERGPSYGRITAGEFRVGCGWDCDRLDVTLSRILNSQTALTRWRAAMKSLTLRRAHRLAPSLQMTSMQFNGTLNRVRN